MKKKLPILKDNTNNILFLELNKNFSLDEVLEWKTRMINAVNSFKGKSFYIYMDCSDMMVISSQEIKDIIIAVQLYCKNHNLIRSVVILAGPIESMLMKKIAKSSGISSQERYLPIGIQAYKQKGVNWLVYGMEPPIDEKL